MKAIWKDLHSTGSLVWTESDTFCWKATSQETFALLPHKSGNIKPAKWGVVYLAE